VTHTPHGQAGPPFPQGGKGEGTAGGPPAKATAADRARALLARGFAVVPVPARSKRARLKGWPKLRIAADQIDAYFQNPCGNIGILWGDASGGVIDIDLDLPLAVELAEQFLPATPAIFGRKSKRRSHFLYRVKAPFASLPLRLPRKPGEKAGAMVAEVRSTGSQTIAPGSVHPSGEAVEWEAEGDPAEVDPVVLTAALTALYLEVLKRLGAPPPVLKASPVVKVLARLQRVSQTPEGYTACCPGHDDGVPSLSIATAEDGKVLLKCHAGCSAEQVVSAIGLTMSDLFPRGGQRRPARRRGEGKGASKERVSCAQQLVEMVLATPRLELFHHGATPYVTLPVEDHLETWPLEGKSFRFWIAAAAHRDIGCAGNPQSVKSAIDTLAGRALYQSPARTVYTRIAGHAGQIFLDLGDALWRVVRIGPSGWEVMSASDCPVRFVRPNGLLALPEPVRGGSVEELRPLLNLRDDDQWTLTLGWLLSAFRPEGPYAALVVCGEAGSCKSTLCKLLRRLIDPNLAAERRLPREERELFIAARNGWLLSYNNIDSIPPQFSDALCSILTEGGHAVRVNFADADELLFCERRPVILNGITCAAARPDLLDRSLILNLDRPPTDRRRDEQEVLSEFQRVWPRVLGALLDAIAGALEGVDRVRLRNKPRIADIVTWVAAAGPCLGWTSDRFLGAVERNQAEAHLEVLESSPLASAVRTLAGQGRWEGTAIELVQVVHSMLSGIAARECPRDPGVMTRSLKHFAPSLRECGVAIEMPTRPEGREKRRVIRIYVMSLSP